MQRLQPTRTVSATRLVTVTTTYETELTQDEFLSLTPHERLVSRLFGKDYTLNLESLAMAILSEHGIDFKALANTVPHTTTDFRAILAILNAFDYDLFGKIMLSEYSEDTGYTIIDGNLRSVALALLLMGREIEYQPVTAVYTEIEQRSAETIGDDALSQTIEKAQQGMKHYPVQRRTNK